MERTLNQLVEDTLAREGVQGVLLIDSAGFPVIFRLQNTTQTSMLFSERSAAHFSELLRDSERATLKAELIRNDTISLKADETSNILLRRAGEFVLAVWKRA